MSICDRVQQAVAVEAAFDKSDRAHLVQCEACGRVYDGYRKLEALVRQCDTTVPDGFADRVMSLVEAEIPTRPAIVPADSLFDRMLEWAPVRYATVALSIALSAAGLGRFVFFVLVPS